ncbi:MAG: HNH endonuclease [Clostridiales bacterium]|nr:HNH endonuclease [Clostridiales bacterium]MCD8116248.1 HNH endonuclease [Oscillospiraceae bacterium]
MTDYLTIKQAITETEVNYKTLYDAFRAGKIQGYKDHNTIYLDRDSLDLFVSNKKIKKGAWGNINTAPKRAFYPFAGYDCKYATTVDGGVVNIDTGTELIQDTDDRGRKIVTLIKDGKPKREYVHRLIMRTQGYNFSDKPEVHHKDKNPSNNMIDNLLAVWPSEHRYLHCLLKEGKGEEYERLQRSIEDYNKQVLYNIPHPDWGERYYMQVTEAGLTAYMAGEEIPLDSVYGEYELWGSPQKPEGFNFEFDFMREGA